MQPQDEMEKREEILISAVKNLDFAEAIDASDPRYVDCSKVRGEEGQMVGKVKLKIQRTIEAGGRPLTILFSGHNGSGKSTELKSLQNRLMREKLFTVRIDAQEVMELNDPDYLDIIVAIASELERQMRDKKLPFPEDLMKNIYGWFDEVIYEKAADKELKAAIEAGTEMKAGIPFIGKLFTKITGQIKTSSRQRKIIRRKLDPRVSELLGLINTMVTRAEIILNANGYEGLIVIFDNLEKMRLSYQDSGDGKSTHEMIFIDNYHILTGLNCHKIYTVPLALLYSHHHTRLVKLYDADYVLPMIKVCQTRSRKADDKGINTLIEIARKRMDVNAIFEDMDLLKRVALFSGGNVREFIRILNYLVEDVPAEDLPLKEEHIGFTFRRIRRDYQTAPSDDDFERLAKVYQTHSIPNDSDHYRMIYSHFILAYTNGDPWYDVHPALYDVPRFKEALKSLERQ